MQSIHGSKRRWPRSDSLTEVKTPVGDTPVRAIMSLNVIKVAPTVEASKASDLAVARHVEHLVVMQGAEVKGVVCTCDLWDATRAPVSAVMSSPAVTLRDNATVGEAATLVVRSGVGCLPVLDDHGKLVGVVTRGDLARIGALDLSSHTCASCGSHHHVKRLAGYDDAFCTVCLDSASPAVPYEELGWGD